MNKHTFFISAVLILMTLLLTACNRPYLRQRNANPATQAQTQANTSPIMKFTIQPSQAQTNTAPAESQPTADPTQALQSQSTNSTTSDSALTSDLNDLSSLFDSLSKDMNSTDTLGDFK